jgi:hypothetical protein
MIKRLKNIQTFEQHSLESNISDDSHIIYLSLNKLFQILPKLGYGDSKEFKGTEKDLEFAHNIIETLGSSGLVFKRTKYLQDGGKLDINEWFDSIKKEKNFQSYMLRNYSIKNGEFIFSKNIDELEKLAEIYFEYYN